ncbi:restriction endonuclease [Bacillus sp. M6-12]|uniref:restriction endonuclease n=1 Tax=Bacillus sp. M6-12 TaxID=2054166 RepID=UPI00115B048D|nr:restriction endonuclease [Bacillus sp. M6-12]
MKEAKSIAYELSNQNHPTLYGVNDGKSIGTYIENQFKERLKEKYQVKLSSSSKGIDLPEINVDIKSTLRTRPQSSCPYKSFRQKIYGLGYHIILFTYEKIDNHEGKYSQLLIDDAYFIEKSETADAYLTSAILQIIETTKDPEELIELFYSVNLPGDESEYEQLAKEVLINPPKQGRLTISNALQWRLQYSKVTQK